MISGAITDAQISASSYIVEGGWAINNCAPTNARPFLANGLAWCPKYKSSTEWLQIDLGVRATVRSALKCSSLLNMLIQLRKTFQAPHVWIGAVPHNRHWAFALFGNNRCTGAIKYQTVSKKESLYAAVVYCLTGKWILTSLKQLIQTNWLINYQ